jgi:hypothetical protein
MLKATIALLLISFAWVAAAETSSQGDDLLVHGKEHRRAGPIDALAGRETLVRIFGDGKLKDTKIVMGEDGVEQPATEILEKGLEATVLWETPARKKPISVLITKPGSRWHTAEGIHVGTSVAELEKINGAPFKFSGLAWDYGGQISSEGKLSKLEGLSLTLGTDVTGPDSEKFVGDQVSPMSNSPGIAKARIRVYSMTLYLVQ